MVGKNLSKEDELILKTICEFLILNRLDDISDYSRFESIFGSLFEKQILKNIFDFIVGTFKDTEKKRKYLTYTRLHLAYVNYKEKNAEKNINISSFFKKLMKIIKLVKNNKNNTIGKLPKNEEEKEENYFSSKRFSDKERYSISNFKLYTDGDQNITGIELEYNDSNKIKFCKDRYYKLCLNLKLEILVNKGDVQIRDSITHIYGIYNGKNIVYIELKSASGKTVNYGKKDKKGTYFLFGHYGQKLQYVNIKFDKNGMCGIEVFFEVNTLKNKNLKLKNDEKDECYYDENILKKSNDDEKNNIIRENQILDLGNNSLDKFEEENIYIEPTSIIPNNIIDPSTTVLGALPNYGKNAFSNNPFLSLDDKDKDNYDFVLNPFFPEEIKKKRRDNYTVVMSVRPDYEKKKNFSESLLELNLNKKYKSDDGGKINKNELNKKIGNIKDKLISNIFQQVLKKQKNGKIDLETNIALNQIIEEDDDENKEETDNEDNKDKDERRKEALDFIKQKYDLKNPQEEGKEKEKNKIDIKKSITENIDNIEEKINKNIEKNDILENINILIDLNKIKKEDKKAIDDDLNDEEEEKLDEEIKGEEQNDELDDECAEGGSSEDFEQKNKNNSKIEEIINNPENVEFLNKFEENNKKGEAEEINAEIKEIPAVNILIKSFFSKKIETEIINNEALPKKLKKWKDKNFDKDKALGNNWKKNKAIKWCQPEEIYNNYYIFKTEPYYKNILQSENKKVYDCYFLSAIGALCDNNKCKNVIKNLFHIAERSKEHAYGIYIYINGVRKLILIDDNLAYDSKNKLFFASSFEKSELWLAFIEKAWAKLLKSYSNFKHSYAKVVFETFLGVYTKQININKISEKNLKEILKESNEYPCCAGTKSLINKFESEHEYTILKFDSSNNTIELNDPRGGIIDVSLKQFMKYFSMIEIAYFKENYHRHEIKFSKEDAGNSKVIKLTINENNDIFINLYQKTKTFCPDAQNPCLAYLMVVKQSKERYEYITSKTSKDEKGYSSITSIKHQFEPGIYYIFCDVNYRYLDNNKPIEDYTVGIFSEHEIKKENELKIINEDNEIDVSKIFHETIKNYCKVFNEKIDKFINLDIYNIRDIEKFPFDIFYILNKISQEESIKFEKLDGKYIYYDTDITNKDNSIVVKIKPKSSDKESIRTVVFMNKDFTSYKKKVKISPF